MTQPDAHPNDPAPPAVLEEESGQFGRIASIWRHSRTSIVGASYMVVQPLLLNALSLPVTAYIIARLGPFDYGQWSIALTLVNTTSALTNLGLRSLFVRQIARDPSVAAAAFAEQLGLRVLLGVAAGIVSVGTGYWLGYPSLVLQCIAILCAATIFSAAAALVADLLSAYERLPALATINFVGGLVLTAASLAAVWVGWGPRGLAVTYVLGPALIGIISLRVVHHGYFAVRLEWNPRRYWEALKAARMLGFQLVVSTIGHQVENLVVPKLVGISQFGYFAAGTLLPRRLDVVSDALNTAFYPVLARDYKASQARGRATVKKLVLLMCAACFPAAAAIFLLAGPIARLLFPESPEICRTIIQITIWWVPLTGLSYAMSYALNAAGREHEEARLAVQGTVLAMVCSVALILAFGLVGACFALVGRAAIGFVIRVPVLLRAAAD